MNTCNFCKKPCNDYENYCPGNCAIEEAKADGGKVHQPNGLPIKCIKYDGNMYEHEHGDHPDYIFPVIVKCVKDIYNDFEGCEDWERQEEHALIYEDGSIALTLYECSYYCFNLNDGSVMYGKDLHEGWVLSQESIDKILDRRNKNEKA